MPETSRKGATRKAKNTNGKSDHDIIIQLGPNERIAITRWLPSTLDVNTILEMRVIKKALRISSEEMQDNNLREVNGYVLEVQQVIPGKVNMTDTKYTAGIKLPKSLWEIIYRAATVLLDPTNNKFPNTDSSLNAYFELCQRCGFDAVFETE